MGVPSSRAANRALVWLGVGAVAFFVVVLLALGWLSGLTGGAKATSPAIDAANRTITLALSQEPPQLNSTLSTDVVSMFVLGHVMEGLLRYDEHNALIPAVAEEWDIRPEGATFRLRPDAVWSDGEPVTAHDFVFAWRLAVDPENAASYAFLFYSIKNGEAINTGKLPLESLGVRAVDDRTLAVEFERPIAYFDKLVSFFAFLPIREDFYRSREGRYAADAVDLLYNGPFTMARWVHGAHVRLEKNEQYWDRDRVRLDAIDLPYITNDSNAHLNLYRDGSIAMVGQSAGLGAESVKQAMNEGWQLSRANDGTVWFVEMNQRPGRLFNNKNLRKALMYASDNTELVYRAMKNPGYSPAKSIFPAWLKGEEGYFRQEYPPPEIKQDLGEARRYLKLALDELGLEKLPPIPFLVDDVVSGIKQAEYFQALFKRTLDIDIVIDAQIFKQRIAKVQNGDFDVASYGWGPDYDDPMTFGDLFASWNPNNHGRYNSPEVDRQVAIAQNSIDPKERMQAFARIQQLLIEDAAMIPNFERGTLFVQDPRLRGVVRRSVGTDPDFTNAYIVAD